MAINFLGTVFKEAQQVLIWGKRTQMMETPWPYVSKLGVGVELDNRDV